MNAAELIAHFEGFGPKAYWDVNAWRLGYGSDTKGKNQIRVTQGMTTTRAEALENLEVRVPQFEAIAKKCVGAATWDRLNPNQQAVCDSLAYNYGHVPIHVDASDPVGTAARIAARGKDNGGVNRRRLKQEANFYLTGTLDGVKAAPVIAAPKPGASTAKVGSAVIAGAGALHYGASMPVPLVLVMVAFGVALLLVAVVASAIGHDGAVHDLPVDHLPPDEPAGAPDMHAPELVYNEAMGGYVHVWKAPKPEPAVVIPPQRDEIGGVPIQDIVDRQIMLLNVALTKMFDDKTEELAAELAAVIAEAKGSHNGKS